LKPHSYCFPSLAWHPRNARFPTFANATVDRRSVSAGGQADKQKPLLGGGRPRPGSGWVRFEAL